MIYTLVKWLLVLPAILCLLAAGAAFILVGFLGWLMNLLGGATFGLAVGIVNVLHRYEHRK